MAVAVACVTRLELNAAMVEIGRDRGRLDDEASRCSLEAEHCSQQAEGRTKQQAEEHSQQQGRSDTRDHIRACRTTTWCLQPMKPQMLGRATTKQSCEVPRLTRIVKWLMMWRVQELGSPSSCGREGRVA